MYIGAAGASPDNASLDDASRDAPAAGRMPHAVTPGGVSAPTLPRPLEVGRIGDVVLRADGVPKVKGEFAYSSDLAAPGMLWGHTVRSPHAHARIRAVDVSEAVTMPGVHAVLTHEDVPGEKTYGLEWRDQPVLAIDRARYFGDPFAIDHFGLPVGSADLGNAYVVRAQRVVFQYWKEDVRWAHRGEVTVANGGDLLKETVLANDPAMTPTLPPYAPLTGPARDHDWRAPGYVSAVGGLLYDRNCVPLRSAGINAPNLLYRAGQDETLAWMRDRRLRWVRWRPSRGLP